MKSQIYFSVFISVGRTIMSFKDLENNEGKKQIYQRKKKIK